MNVKTPGLITHAVNRYQKSKTVLKNAAELFTWHYYTLNSLIDGVEGKKNSIVG